MKCVAYSILPFENEPLIIANKKKHNITLITDSLSVKTAYHAAANKAVLVFTSDDVSEPIIKIFADLGVKYITTRSTGTDHIDKIAADKYGIKINNVPSYSPQAIAEQAVALALALSRSIVPTAQKVKQFNFTIDRHIGFNFYGKTVGILGMGSIGKATAAIFNGLGCKVIGFDIAFPSDAENVNAVSLDKLLAEADIISLHAPLTSDTHYMINKESIAKMKTGVMLINTSRGGLINTIDAIKALEGGKIGYLGLDVYESEKGLFFQDHSHDIDKDQVLEKLIAMDNVIVTPHQGFLTHEALQEIAAKTIDNLDVWENEFKR